MPAALSLIWLAALAVPGIAALARFAPFLTPLERFAHGAVLGIVAGTIVLVPLATLAGLGPLVIAGTGAVAITAGIALAAVPPRGGRRPAPVDELRDAIRTARAAGPMATALARLDPWATALLIGLTAWWSILWTTAIQRAEDGLWAGHEYIWSDWPTHLGIVTRFAWGDNFPPENTLYAGLPLSYHYLSDLTPAAFVVLGLDPVVALPLHSFALSIVAALSLWAFVRRLGIAPALATLGTALFLLGAGLGWVTTAATLDRLKDLFVTLTTLPWDEKAVGELHIRFFNPYLAFLMSQRAYLYGLPLAMLMLTLLVSAARRRSVRRFVLAGVVGGLLPLSHLPTLLAMAIVVPFLAILLPSRPWRDPLRRIPWAGWIAFGLVWIAVALPQLLSQLGGGAGALSAFRFQLGWVAEPDPWWWFWVKNLGLFIPLALVGLAVRRAVPPRSARLLVALWSIFVVANLAAFQPWDWDNHKILVYWFLGVAIAAAAALVHAWHRFPGLAVRLLIVLAVATMVGSPVLEIADQAQGNMRYRMLETEQIELAERLRDASAPGDLVVTGMQSHDPVMMLSGRQILMGYWGQLWVSGIPYEERQRQVGEIYKLSAEGEARIREHGVDYVVIGPDERRADGLAANEEAYAARFPIAVATARWRVYDVRELSGDTEP